ncbi:MAG: hypothetical protein V1878_08205 [bacterium]
MVGKDKMGEPFDGMLDPLVPDDPEVEAEGWEWEEEEKHQKIRKKKLPEREEGASFRRGRGGPFRKKK